MHPLTLATVGVYGESLPNQNGAHWPEAYGFYCNVSVAFRVQRPMPWISRVRSRFRNTGPTILPLYAA